MDSGRERGGIFERRERIAEHEAEITYDFRSRFNIGLDEIGDRITWRETVQLVTILLRDPSSWLQASARNWKHPASYEWTMLASIFDAQVMANSKKKPKPFPRPWQNTANRTGGKTRLPRHLVMERLALMNPKESDGL